MNLADFIHVDLLTVGIAVAGIGLLGVLIYFNNPSSATNRAFLHLSLAISLWSIANYVNYQSGSPQFVLWALRALMFFSVFFAYTLFHFLYVFPNQSLRLPGWHDVAVVPATLFVALLALTPVVFTKTVGIVAAGSVAVVQVGPGIVPFTLLAIFLDFGGIAFFVLHMRSASADLGKQFKSVLSGIIITISLIFTLDFLLPAFFHIYNFIPYGAVFILPFVAFTSYAIYRHHLLNLKVAATAALGFMVTIFSFVNVVYASSLGSLVLNITAFSIVLLGSVRIVRDTIALQIAKEELELANQQQESLLHFISHEIKGYLTKSEAGFASIVEGDFGAVPDALKGMAQNALAETRKGVATIMDILDAANLKKGTVSYKKEPFDFKAALESIIESQKQAADEKHLALNVSIADGSYAVQGDQDKISRHVIRNLIDNAVKYTPTGDVDISLSRLPAQAGDDGNIKFTVRDSGVGITPEDMQHLFTEGGHGKDSLKVNVHSTGYGLYIAKQVVDAHGGKIWAESEGQGKGARFVVELPAA